MSEIEPTEPPVVETPAESGEAPKGRDPVQLLAGVALASLLVWGLALFHGMASQMTARRPKGSSGTSTPGARPGDKAPLYRTSGLFGNRSLGAPPPASAGKPDDAVALMINFYRDMLHKLGIRDEDTIVLIALDQSDRRWSDSEAKAQFALENEQLDEAKRLVEEALRDLDPRHLKARIELLTLLRRILQQQGDQASAKEAVKQSYDARMKAMEILAKGLSEQRKGGAKVDTSIIQTMIREMGESRDMEKDATMKGAEAFMPQGEDPDKAPDRIQGFMEGIAGAQAGTAVKEP